MIISDGKIIKCYNGTGVTINSNKVVIVKGKQIVIASNTDVNSTQYPLGYTLSSINPGEYGEVLLEGSIQNINSNIYGPINTILYLGTSGGITTVKPTNSIILGSIIVSDLVNGSIYFKVSIDLKGIPAGGNEGDILAKASATNYDVEWIENYTSNVKHIVKLAEPINKGQAVYVSDADGTNMIVSKASNNTEATSSKTMGLLAFTGTTNDQGFIITEGLLAGIDTSMAVAKDPVWLGVDGNLIYGLTNKPTAPDHLVFIGVVTRSQQNNGEIFVKIQNGFELNELHNVSANDPQRNDFLSFNADTNLWENTPLKRELITDVLGYTPYDDSNPEGYINATALATALTAYQELLTLTTLGSSGPATLIGNTLNIPQYSGGSSQTALQKAATGYEYYNDFLSTSTLSGTSDGQGYIFFFSGTSAGVVSSTFPAVRASNQHGFIRPITGTQSTGYAGLYGGSSGNQFLLGGGVMTFQTSVLFNTVSTGVERYRAVIGYGNQATSAAEVNGIFFTYDEGGTANGTSASPNWQCVTSANSVRTLTTTSVAVSTTAWHILKIEINAGGTSVAFYIDNTLVATHTTNIPSGTSQTVTPRINISKTLGTTSRFFHVDYLYYAQTYTTSKSL